MHLRLEGGFHLRKPEATDVERLWSIKNDPEAAALLGGSSTGWTRADLAKWVERHASAADEVLWVIADEQDRVVGHVGLYKIHRAFRSAEFAILLDRAVWGQGVGKRATREMIRYGFEELDLQRIELSVLAENARARALYQKLGFVEEGRLRRAVYKAGRHHDMLVMGLLREELR